jgi:hypothetical protein
MSETFTSERGVAGLPHEIQTLFSRAILDRAAWLFSGEGFCAGGNIGLSTMWPLWCF